MNRMYARRYETRDATEVITLIKRNLLEVNSKDYGIEAMQKAANTFTIEKINENAKNGHMYVIIKDETIVGTGTISSFNNRKDESILLTIFVLPKYHRFGIGRYIIQTLQKDPLFLQSKRIEIPASITACGFYEKMGYSYKNGIKELDEDKHYRMEKFK